MPASLFVSDLHLPAGSSPLRERFIQFLTGPAREASAVYILGDLFEYWIGDDAGMLDHAREVAELAVLTQRGVPVFFQHGNRDFLVGPDFSLVSGVQLLRDPVVVDLHGTPTLLSHGDIFCTGDRGYQRWRGFTRNRAFQYLFGLLPLAQRRRIAGGVRRRSDEHKQDKAADIMDVEERAVRAAFARHGVQRMIHGHTHRPSTHRYMVRSHSCERIVLADWRSDHTEYLRVDERGIQRLQLS